MEASGRDAAARWLVEALETGLPLAPLPSEASPRSLLDGQRIAARVVDLMGLAPVGLRLAHAPGGRLVPGPMLEGRLLQDGAKLPLSALHHARACPAVVAVLAEDLPRRGDELPALATLHPALDIVSWRLRDLPSTMALAAADLAGLGYVVAGKGRRTQPQKVRVALSVDGAWDRGQQTDLEEALQAAALAARRAGGLPAGAVLVVQLSEGCVPVAGQAVAASFGRLGRVEASIV